MLLNKDVTLRLFGQNFDLPEGEQTKLFPPCFYHKRDSWQVGVYTPKRPALNGKSQVFISCDDEEEANLVYNNLKWLLFESRLEFIPYAVLISDIEKVKEMEEDDI